MRFAQVRIEAIAYELPPTVVASESLEDRLAPLYDHLRLKRGQLEALTGIRERRFWETGTTMADGAARAARKLMSAINLTLDHVGLLIYAGVCRDQLEPATGCAVAHALGLGSCTQVYDISNACLGVMNGVVQAANAIELGQVQAALVVSCESARQIVDLTIDRMLAANDMRTFAHCLATLTGGSGAIAVLVVHESLSRGGHRLHGGVIRSRTEHHGLCRWGPDSGIPSSAPMVMNTDSVGVLEHGIALGIETWQAFLEESGWSLEQIERTICHQVGAPHRDAVLKALGMPLEKDFQTYEYLGNIGTVSLPITAAIAEQRGFLRPGQRVAFCGIGSGLNCLILGVEW